MKGRMHKREEVKRPLVLSSGLINFLRVVGWFDGGGALVGIQCDTMRVAVGNNVFFSCDHFIGGH